MTWYYIYKTLNTPPKTVRTNKLNQQTSRIKKINMQKSVLFIYTNTELSEKINKNNNPIYNSIENNT